MGKLLRGMSRDGSAQILVLNSRDMVQKAIGYHGSAPTASAALGRVLTATSLMASTLKDKGNSITVNFRGNGPCGHILAVGDYKGNVKGYVQNPDTDLPRKANGKLDVAAAVGTGTLNVVKDTGEKEPYIGIVDIKTGEIAEDITEYFATSEQIPSVCSLGVLISGDKSCRAAGGLLIELLPFASENTISQIEENLPSISGISSLFDKGMTNREIADLAFADITYDIFDEYEVAYRCDCSRDRMGKALCTLGPYELFDLFSKQKEVELGCQFCNMKYKFTAADVEKYRKLKKAEEEN